MTGINASKIIQNLEFVNSFCCANLVAGERKHSAPIFSSFLFSLSAFRFGFLNWVRCKPVGPRRGEGADGSRSLFTSSIGTQNPELGPIRETIVRQLKGQSEPALLHFEIGLDLRWGQGLPLAFVRMAKALADFLAELLEHCASQETRAPPKQEKGRGSGEPSWGNLQEGRVLGAVS